MRVKHNGKDKTCDTYGRMESNVFFHFITTCYLDDHEYMKMASSP